MNETHPQVWQTKRIATGAVYKAQWQLVHFTDLMSCCVGYGSARKKERVGLLLTLFSEPLLPLALALALALALDELFGLLLPWAYATDPPRCCSNMCAWCNCSYYASACCAAAAAGTAASHSASMPCRSAAPWSWWDEE